MSAPGHYTDKVKALRDALRVSNSTGHTHWVIATYNPTSYAITAAEPRDHFAFFKVEPDRSDYALMRLLDLHGVRVRDPRQPREMYRVAVDLAGWIAAAPEGERRQHPSSTKNDYRAPIYTTSPQQVTAIITQFGEEFVTVSYAELAALKWAAAAWPRPKARNVICISGESHCPHCNAVDSVVEIDTDTREKQVVFDQAGNAAVEEGTVNYQTLRHECSTCRGEIRLLGPPA